MGAPAVTVTIPVYNGEAYVASAIESVLAQTHCDFELIVVDDASTDATPEIVGRFCKQDSRVVARRLDQKVGGPAARNVGLELARAEWVAVLDHDDLMLPHRLERQLAFISQHPDVRAFASRAQYINSAGVVFGEVIPPPIFTPEQFEVFHGAGEIIWFCHSAVMLHRATVLSVGGYRPDLCVAQDIDLWMRLADAGHLLLQHDETLTQYRVHDQSITVMDPYRSSLYCAYVIACARARRGGEPEPSLADFDRRWRTRPLLRRVSDLRRQMGWSCYRTAGACIANRQFTRGLPQLAVAFALRPVYVLSRLWSQVPIRRTLSVLRTR